MPKGKHNNFKNNTVYYNISGFKKTYLSIFFFINFIRYTNFLLNSNLRWFKTHKKFYNPKYYLPVDKKIFSKNCYLQFLIAYSCIPKNKKKVYGRLSKDFFYRSKSLSLFKTPFFKWKWLLRSKKRFNKVILSCLFWKRHLKITRLNSSYYKFKGNINIYNFFLKGIYNSNIFRCYYYSISAKPFKKRFLFPCFAIINLSLFLRNRFKDKISLKKIVINKVFKLNSPYKVTGKMNYLINKFISYKPPVSKSPYTEQNYFKVKQGNKYYGSFHWNKVIVVSSIYQFLRLRFIIFILSRRFNSLFLYTHFFLMLYHMLKLLINSYTRRILRLPYYRTYAAEPVFFIRSFFSSRVVLKGIIIKAKRFFFKKNLRGNELLYSTSKRRNSYYLNEYRRQKLFLFRTEQSVIWGNAYNTISLLYLTSSVGLNSLFRSTKKRFREIFLYYFISSYFDKPYKDKKSLFGVHPFESLGKLVWYNCFQSKYYIEREKPDSIVLNRRFNYSSFKIYWRKNCKGYWIPKPYKNPNGRFSRWCIKKNFFNPTFFFFKYTH